VATQSDPVSNQAVTGDTSWRLTKFGWQDSSAWVSDAFAPHPTLELIHPATWALLVLLSVIVATIWASNEWEFERLLPASHAEDN
jgi:hypothetical protein